MLGRRPTLRSPGSCCSRPNFGRSEQEHELKGNKNKSAKYGLTNFKYQIKPHLRPCAGNLLTENQTVRELIKGGVPWLPYHGRFGPIVISKTFECRKRCTALVSRCTSLRPLCLDRACFARPRRQRADNRRGSKAAPEKLWD